MTPQNIMKAKFSAKGWGVIPAASCQRFGLKPGAMVEFQETGRRIVIVPRTSDSVEGVDASLTKALLGNRAKKVKREEALNSQ
jgi:bifunctional DNA-binding transcriptional regulator/antitoxin component of YhaV-PrlF toxin-antitoxin module